MKKSILASLLLLSSALTVIAQTPEIHITGNSVTISDGDFVPTTADHSDFGSVLACTGTIVRTFVIHNTGTGNLNISSVTVGGPAAPEFSSITMPVSPVLPGGSAAFTVTFDPATTGMRSAVLTINNDDSDEGVYDFGIQGTGNSDIVNPSIACPGSISVNASPGLCSAVVTYVAPVGTDNCPSVVTTQIAGLSSGSAFPVGVTVNTFRATDGSGNTATCSFSVTVTDSQAPVLYTMNTSASSNAAAIAYSDGWQTGDNDGSGFGAWTLTASTGNSSQAGFLMGSSTTNGAGADLNGDQDINTSGLAWGMYANSAQATQAVRPLTAPLAVGGVLTAELDNGNYDPGQIIGFQLQNSSGQSLGEVRYRGGQAGYEMVDANGITPFGLIPVTDEGIIIEVTSLSTGQASIKLTRKINGVSQTITSALFPGGGNQVIRRVMIFNSNNGAGADKILYVNKLRVATVTPGCPVNISVSNSPGVCGATVTYSPVLASDNCAIALPVTQTSGLASGSLFPVGTTTNAFTVTDGAGNISSCSFTVTVADTADPVATCRNLTLYLNNTTGTASVTPPMVDNGSTDNCGIATRTVIPNSFSCANIGPNNVTLTVTDASGNSSVCVGVVTVLDSAHPVANCQNVTLQLNTAGSATIIPAMLNNGSTDNCGITSMSVSQNSFSCANIGPNSVTLTVTDNSGNSSTCIGVVTVADTVRPVANCQNISVHLNAAGTANITGAMVNNGSTDACGIASLSVSPSSFTCANVGANNVTLTVTDVNGRTSTCNSIVTVIDTVRPVANCQNISVHLNAAGTANITGAMVNNGSTDACGIASLSVSPSSFTCANVGANNVTLTVTDVNGRTSTCTSVVTVIDTVRPAAICRSGTIQIPLDGTGNATILSSLIDNGSNDACGISLMTVSPNTFNCASQGFPTLTLTVTDVNGNTSTCTSTAIVFDGVPPIANCQNINVYLDGSGNANIVPAMVNNGSTDECQMATMSVTPTSFNCSNTGPNNVTLTVFDTMGANDQCVSIVTVIDSTRPVANCHNITLQLNAAGLVSITPAMLNNGSTDNCGIASMSVSQNSFSCANIGPNNVTLTVTDNSGNSSTCIGVVTVADTVRPVANCQNISVHLNAAGTANITGAMVNNGSTDACGIASLSVSPSSFTCANVGANNVTLTVTDVNGRTSTCNSIVTVIDTVRPVANCQNISVHLNAAGTANITGAMVNNGSTDACGIASLSVSPSSFTCANVGANNVTLTVTDVNGRTSTCNSVVTVIDTVRPVANCQNVTAYLDASGVASVNPLAVNNGSTDNCGTIGYSLVPSGFVCSQVGANTSTFTVFDISGNSSMCTTTIIVVDTIRPIAIAQNLTVTLSGGIATVTAASINNGSSDACGIASMSVTPNSFTCSNLGANTVTLTVTDVNGNVSTATATVTVLSDLTSSATVNNHVSCFGGSNGQATITTSGGAGIFTYSWSPTGGSAATSSGLSVGTYTVTATDGGGCTTSSTVNITEPLTATAATSVSGNILCNGGSTTVTVTGNGGTSPYTGEGTFTVTAGTYSYTVTDGNGCTATTSVTITEPTPLVPTSSGLSVLCNGGTTTVTVACTGGTAPYTGTGTFTEVAGTFFYTVTDANGCTAVTSINISEPVVLAANSSTFTPILCNGGTAVIVVSGAGGTSPYSGTGSFTATAGTYSYTITDANGCTATTSITVTEPTALSAGSSSTSVLCNGGTATVTVTGSGGTSPYTGAGTFTVSAGNYSYTVTDANGCTATTSITVTEPTALSAGSSSTSVLCNGGTATVTVTGSGGTSPYTGAGTFTVSAGNYSYTVTDANGCTATTSITVTEPTALSAGSSASSVLCNGGTATVTVNGSGGTAPYTGEGIFTVTAGSYSYTVTDANGCTATTSITITEPTAISSSVISVNVSCNGGADGSIDLTVSGGTLPYVFDWNSGTYTTEDISGLVAGTYTGVLTDANGCTNSGTITIMEPAMLVAVVTSATNPTSCSGTDGAIDITISGGTTGYTFLWNTSATSEDLSGITAGSYSCTVTDANGCTTTASASLSDPNAPTVLLSLPLDTVCFDDGAITLSGESPLGGVFSGPGVSSGSFVPTVAGIGTHIISYTYTDLNGCTGSTTDSVNVDACLGVTIAEANQFEVYPNPNNGSFTVQLNGTTPATASIYDVQGKLVSTHNLQSAAAQQLHIDVAGIYVIVVITSDNQMSSQRIVVTE